MLVLKTFASLEKTIWFTHKNISVALSEKKNRFDGKTEG